MLGSSTNALGNLSKPALTFGMAGEYSRINSNHPIIKVYNPNNIESKKSKVCRAARPLRGPASVKFWSRGDSYR